MARKPRKSRKLRKSATPRKPRARLSADDAPIEVLFEGLKPIFWEAPLRAAEIHRALVARRGKVVPTKFVTRTGAVRRLKPDFWRGKLLATPGGSLRVLDLAPEFHADDGFVGEAVAAPEEQERQATYFYVSRSAAAKRWPALGWDDAGLRARPRGRSKALAAKMRPVIPAAKLRPAPDATVRDEIRAEYKQAAESGSKPPNIRELGTIVRHRLNESNLDASYALIERIGGEDEFKLLRQPVGQRWR